MNIRKERIERLLDELRYEIERGMLEREIEETLSFNFIVPISQSIKDGIVLCKFETRPVHRCYAPSGYQPRLKLLK